MNGHLVEVGVVFLPLQALGSVLLVLGGDIPGHSGYAARLLLGALEDNLYPVTFLFLCHDYEY